MARTRPWEVRDQMWEKVQPLIPPAPSHAKGGRPRMDDRKAFEAMVYVLSTGIQWNALPRELGASTTVYNRFQEWKKAGFFRSLWQAGLYEYGEVKGIEREWQSVDEAMQHQPLKVQGTTGPNRSCEKRVKRRWFPDGSGMVRAESLVDGVNQLVSLLLVATDESNCDCPSRGN